MYNHTSASRGKAFECSFLVQVPHSLYALTSVSFAFKQMQAAIGIKTTLTEVEAYRYKTRKQSKLRQLQLWFFYDKSTEIFIFFAITGKEYQK